MQQKAQSLGSAVNRAHALKNAVIVGINAVNTGLIIDTVRVPAVDLLGFKDASAVETSPSDRSMFRELPSARGVVFGCASPSSPWICSVTPNSCW